MEWGGVGWDQKAGEKVKLEPRGRGEGGARCRIKPKPAGSQSECKPVKPRWAFRSVDCISIKLLIKFFRLNSS